MTKLGKSAKGLNPINDTAVTAKDRLRTAGPGLVQLNNAYRKAKEQDPTLEFRMTFLQWKREYMREWDKKKRIRKRLKHRD